MPHFDGAEPVIGAPPQPPSQTAAPEGADASLSAAQPPRVHTADAPVVGPPPVQSPPSSGAPQASVEPPRAATPPPSAQPYPAQSATAETSAAAWESTQTSAQTAGAPWQSAASAEPPRAGEQPASWLPDRIHHASHDPSERVEVLPALTSADLLSDIAAARRAQLKSTSGMRGALNKVGFNLGLSPAEQRKQDRRGRIRRPLTAPYQIAVVSVKGGVGRTTLAATLGSTFAHLRPDRVVAVDANPDFGDLPTRTSAHPYGLTLRDLVRSSNLEAFSAVHSFTSINDADLAVIASPWNTEATEALSGREYSMAVEILRRHYNLVLVDCGTGVLDSATSTVLQTSDAVVVATPATVGGVKGAVATLNWLNSHGMQHLIAKSIVAIMHHHPTKPTVEVDQIEKLFATAQRPTAVVPYDPHLAEGGPIDLRLLESETLLAFEELAAALADGFDGYQAQRPSQDRGEWR
ncbi:AAA family ATPase [Nocardia vinacea]|uniref:AAA family ATPase n=1 Tax=Nocardia vinacea TaxID=96468 RepID=UPI001FDEF5A4|nr:MinD/ParA family protein [Nocardia vinacea]